MQNLGRNMMTDIIPNYQLIQTLYLNHFTVKTTWGFLNVQAYSHFFNRVSSKMSFSLLSSNFTT